VFVHSYDVHCPWDPAPEYAELFHSVAAEPLETARRCGNVDYNRMSLTDGQIRHVSDMYDASIRQVDVAMGAFFERLRASGRLEDTVVIVTSDHGEEFGEHGQIGHQRTLYREALRIPLILVAPGLEPRRVASSASLVDVVPTVLDLLGVRTPPRSRAGASSIW
jgi:arylsulfatase A-like enzyme